MKKTKVCPKCGCKEIVYVPGSTSDLGSGNNIRIGLSHFSSVLVERYVCCECGYSEEWINTAEIKSLKKKYYMYK